MTLYFMVEDTALHQLVLHAAIDVVEDRVWETSAMYLKVVDKFNDLLVSCYNTATHTRLLLLHDGRQSEDGVRAFFTDLHELYLKAMLCPFHTERTPIESPRFDQLVRASARRNL